MSLTIRAKGTSFTKFLGFENIVSVTSGLLGSYFLGSENSNTYNRYGAENLSVVGAPTINSQSAICSPADGFDTKFFDQENQTLIAVVKKAAGQRALISNFSVSSPSAGTLMYFNNGNLSVQYAVGTNMAQASTTLPGSNGEVLFCACTVSTTGAASYAGNGATLSFGTVASTGRRVLPAAVSMKIGAHNYTGVVTGSSEIYGAQIYNRVLSPAELQEMYETLKSIYGGYGVVIK